MRSDQDKPLQIPQYEQDDQQIQLQPQQQLQQQQINLQPQQQPEQQSINIQIQQQPQQLSQNQKSDINNNNIFRLSDREYYIVKSCLLLLGKIFGVPDDEYPIIHDPIMYNWLSSLNEKVNRDEHAAKILQISSSLLMDLSFLGLFGYWVVRVRTGRVIYVIAAFFILRNIMQQIVVFPFPNGFYWDDPGFPSLAVPYGRQSDFFWSGHCGFLTIVACEWFVLQRYKMFVVTCLVNLYQSLIMVGFRIHYSVDIVMGVVMGHYLFTYFSKAAPYFDDWIKRAFYFIISIVKPIKAKKQNNQQIQKQKISPSVQVHNGASVEENRA